MEATNACEPSPPAIPRQSAPRAMASRASSARSSPWSSITVWTPSEVASSTNPNFSTLPPPDHGLQSRTGYEGRLARCTRLAAVVRRLAANAARAARTAVARSARQMSARTKDSQSSAPAPNRAATRRAAPRIAPMIPYQRRGGRFEMAHHPPAMPSANPAAPSATYTPLRTRKPITATARSKTATSEMNGENSGSSRRGATRVTHVVSPPSAPDVYHQALSCSCHGDDEASDAAGVWPSPCTIPWSSP